MTNRTKNRQWIKLSLTVAFVSLLWAILSQKPNFEGRFMSIFDIFSPERVQWTTRIFAPQHYPVRLVTGDNFWFYKGDRIYGFTGEAYNGWRDHGNLIKGGIPDSKALLPHAVQLTWLAETERKFYQVQIPLPREKILELFDTPIPVLSWGQRKVGNYKAIDFAFEPGGRVHLRVSGQQTITLDTFTATEIPVEWWYFARAESFDSRWITEEKYYALRDPELPEYIKERYKNGTIPKDRWLNYHRTKFPWKVAITGIDLETYRVRLANGDYYWVDPSDMAVERTKNKQLPTEFTFNYIENGKRYRHEFFLTDYDGGFSHPEQPDEAEPLWQLFNDFFSNVGQKSFSTLEFIKVGDIKNSDNPNIANLNLNTLEPDQNFVALLHNGDTIVQVRIYRHLRKLLQDGDF